MTRYVSRPKSSVGPAAAVGGAEAPPTGKSVTVRLTVTGPSAGHAFRCTVMLPAAEHAQCSRIGVSALAQHSVCVLTIELQSTNAIRFDRLPLSAMLCGYAATC